MNQKFGIRQYIGFWLLFSVLRYLSGVTLIILGTRIPFAAKHSLDFYEISSVLTFLSSLSLFMVFKKIRMGHNRWINLIASAGFGVYLIHDNSIVRPFLWRTVFKNAAYQNAFLLIPYSIGAACLVYAVCTMIDLLRQASIEKVFLSIVDANAEKLPRPFEAVISFCRQTVFGNQED